MDVTYQYLKKRGDFGRQPLFCEAGPDMCDTIPPDPAEQKMYILRNPVHTPTQNTPNFSEHYINTKRVKITNSGANHAEGGWPKDINVNDVEATQRYRRKIEKEDTYIRCVMATREGMEHYIYQNNAIDLYNSYYSIMPPQSDIERISARTLNVYRDFSNAQRPVNSISWQAECGSAFAVTYVDVDFYRRPRGSIAACSWDIENPNVPELVFEPPCILFDLQYSPRESNVLCGGLATGQICVFDKRSGPVPILVTPIHVAHRDIANSVLFNSKTGYDVFSSGPDGCVKWWDLRKPTDPTDEMIIDIPKFSFDIPSMVTACGVTRLQYESTLPTRFLVATENGLVVGGNRKGKTATEKLPFNVPCHDGPVWSLDRNPGFLKNFLTVGDWTVKIWSEECRESPILWSAPARHRFTAGNWSPTRLSLLSLTSTDGNVSFWDLLRRQFEPVLTMQLPHPLLKQAFHEKGQLLATGDKKGNIYMVELSLTLVDSDAKDKNLLTAMFEREAKRERILEARMREIKLKQRQAEEETTKGHSMTDVDPTTGDRDLSEAASDYFQQVKRELAGVK